MKRKIKKKKDANFVCRCLSAGTALGRLFCPPIKEGYITNSTLSPKERRVKFSENPSKHRHDFYYSKFNPTFSECAWREGRILPLCPGKVSCDTERSFSKKRHLTGLTLSSQLERINPSMPRWARRLQVQYGAFMPSSGRLRSLAQTRGSQGATRVRI